MFTGIIEELGSVVTVTECESGARLAFAAEKVVEGALDGESIAVNGVCLTALNITAVGFEADLSQETLDRSTLGGLLVGSPVNLERAVTPTTRLGGHIVQGHVDGRGRFESAVQTGDFWTVTVSFSKELSRYLVYKGSITVEGVSLTIAALRDSEFDIAVIPKTWDVTNFSKLEPGAPVNLEVDIIAKYVERLLTHKTEKDSNREGVTMEKLRSLGFA
ncbi:MAG: riboflavin synthase [Acidobacteriota bacterium]|nr:riboflavin synthase [Acidobacteriota bacterium]MDH3528625.1 riboflavin synthase [Acidobacteriota bacterium]